MLQVKFIGAESLADGISLVAEQLGITLSDSPDLTITVKEQNEPLASYVLDGGKATIVYGGGKARFFRSLASLIAAYREDGAKEMREVPLFTMNGTMFDTSRNAVMKPEHVKYLFRVLSLMGMNTFMLYTEDMYEVPQRPYFGYMRGRYTEDELRDLDAYALKLGIELIPCIQLLGHLATTLRWDANKDIADTANVLLEGSEETYRFVTQALTQVKKCFSTKKLHMGMDETHDLGLGKFLDLNGYEKRDAIYFRHLQRVSKIAADMGLEPMIWSDMFFRMAGQEQKLEGYVDYDVRVKLPENIGEKVPANVTPVFWDYYNADENFYASNLEKHRLFGKDTIFAGGIWCWGGFAPQFNRSLRNSVPALDACRKAGTKGTIATVWHDGSEASLILAIAHFALYADYDYTGAFDEATLSATLKRASGEDYASLVSAQCIEYPEPGNDEHGASRALVYNDPLVGLADKSLAGIDFKGYYEAAMETLSKAKVTPMTAPAMKVIEKLACLLRQKADYGLRLKAAYDAGDKAKLAELKDESREIAALLEDARKAHRDSWFFYNKPFGWEVHDLRYGALIARFDTVEARLGAYLAGEIPAIDELAAERLLFRAPIDGQYLRYDWDRFSVVFTPSII
ncbi:MAG: beta-N-acetylhexosaminidase [Clostridia bacterium]|nr:beta-N-acetylhexosaminidase [Clostridia bacterium]